MSKEVYVTQMYHSRGSEGGAPSRRSHWRSGGEAPSRFFVIFWKKKLF